MITEHLADQSHLASLAISQMKNKIVALRIELKDALMMAYGAEMNWPKTALKALGDVNDY